MWHGIKCDVKLNLAVGGMCEFVGHRVMIEQFVCMKYVSLCVYVYVYVVMYMVVYII